jgi:hypothetical protein
MPRGVRQVENDQPLDEIRPGHRQEPGDRAAPVVPHDDRAGFAQVADDGGDVGHEQLHVVGFFSRGLVAEVVPAQIDRGDAKPGGGQRPHLLAPRVPEVREPVEHDDERALPELRVVDLHAAAVGVAVRDPALDVGALRERADRPGERRHQNGAGNRAVARHGLLTVLALGV